LTLVVRDQVLANLDRNMMQATSLAVHRNGVIRCVGHAVRLVVTDHEPVFAFQQIQEQMGKAAIAIVEHARMPGPGHAHKDWRKTVHRNQRRLPPSLPPPVKLGFDPLVVRLEYRAHAYGFLLSAQADVSRDSCEFAGLRDRRLRARRAVAVDDETRIILQHQGGV
jgi:hypothetical protein